MIGHHTHVPPGLPAEKSRCNCLPHDPTLCSTALLPAHRFLNSTTKDEGSSLRQRVTEPSGKLSGAKQMLSEKSGRLVSLCSYCSIKFSLKNKSLQRLSYGISQLDGRHHRLTGPAASLCPRCQSRPSPNLRQRMEASPLGASCSRPKASGFGLNDGQAPRQPWPFTCLCITHRY